MSMSKVRPRSLSHVIRATTGCGVLECDQIVKRIRDVPNMAEQVCEAYENKDGQLVLRLIDQLPARVETDQENAAGG